MQPYFFPYLGYFQLIRAADVFIFHDDVQYIKAGWVNRNRILSGGQVRWLTLPVRADGHSRAINQRHYVREPVVIRGMLRRLDAAYRHAPRFADVFPMLCEIIEFGETNVAAFNINLVRRLCRELGLSPRFCLASTLDRPHCRSGQDRVIALCRRVGASGYINPIGGSALYDRDAFAEHGIDLQFLATGLTGDNGNPFLSIIHTLMFNDNRATTRLLAEHRLISA